ncbi:hypothetical protein Q8A64_18325 [Oxalobacteraceae bacterium R-40]|uniref:Uncharacterized protein n=1 Tax=Keguizhuia sedimenti TaxID=3064264 RepID=A0ABU1BTP1_9BURK|nr:hypothetical protein [Oxalobacteraceae bacterium R-40]
MNTRPISHPLSAAAAAILLLGASHVFAAGDSPPRGAARGTASASQQDATTPIYGSQLMTAEERSAYREKMREAKTLEEREKIRTEHHETMQARARERGVTLPEVPPARGPGMGPGMGPGSGPGMGPGMGTGRGSGAGPGMGPGSGTGRGSGRTTP